jgi:outer membrane protein OmpA-like peptidoglycan-associated protein
MLLPVLIVSGIANLAVLVLLGYWLGSRSPDPEATPSTESVATAAPGEDTSPETTGTTVVPSTEPTTALAGLVTSDNPEGALRYAVISGGKAFLRGYVPSREAGDQAVATAAAVLGPENVVDEYVVDPRAPLDVPTPVYIDDAVLFESGSAEIAPDFVPLLEQGLVFLNLRPESTITVVARTDAAGPEDFNLDLSSHRAQAVIDYWVERGADPSQLIADPRGEEEAMSTADGAAAATDRRVEFVVNGLID